SSYLNFFAHTCLNPVAPDDPAKDSWKKCHPKEEFSIGGSRKNQDRANRTWQPPLAQSVLVLVGPRIRIRPPRRAAASIADGKEPVRTRAPRFAQIWPCHRKHFSSAIGTHSVSESACLSLPNHAKRGGLTPARGLTTRAARSHPCG